MIEGKGCYIYAYDRCETPEEIAWLAKNSGMSHMLVKIADGIFPSAGPVERLIRYLDADGIQVVAWVYVYAGAQAESDVTIRLCSEYGIQALVVNAEKEFDIGGMDGAAHAYMARLRSALGDDVVLGLSSYRYPSVHNKFPWRAFLEYCDVNLPQVYWIGETAAMAPVNNLAKSLAEFKTLYAQLKFSRPIVFTGAAFSEHGWRASPIQVFNFMREVERLAMNESLVLWSVNFWEWWESRVDTFDLWPVIANYPWRYVTMSDFNNWSAGVTGALRSMGHIIPDPPASIFPTPDEYQVKANTKINLRDKPGGKDIGDVFAGKVVTIRPPTQRAILDGNWYVWGEVVSPADLLGWIALENTTRI